MKKSRLPLAGLLLALSCLAACYESRLREGGPVGPPITFDAGRDTAPPPSACPPWDEGRACLGSPMVPVPVRTTSAGALYHHTVGRCLPVSHDVAFATHVPRLIEALGAWDEPSCSRMCFGPPEELDTVDECDRRLHLHVDRGVDRTVGYRLEFVVSEATGRIQRVDAYVDPSDARLREASFWVGLTGAVIGLEPTRGVESSVAPGSRLDAPTEPDIQTVCAIYGRPPFCD